MDVKEWEGGLHALEVKAIQKIKSAFSAQIVTSKANSHSTNWKDALGQVKPNKMFPWYGYAGFRLVDTEGYEGEYDLVIVTHCNVLIIELKDWNNGDVISEGDRWFKNNQDMGRSPVSVTRNKKYSLEKKLKKYKNRFSNKGFLPNVDFFVVMCGNASFDKLHNADKKHTISLEQLLNFADESIFNSNFKPHSNAKVLNQDFNIFDDLFSPLNTRPKNLAVGGYRAVEEIFVHPKKVYKEFIAVSESSKNDHALIRSWAFNKLDEPETKTQTGRYKIISREREVLQQIKVDNLQLFNSCLRSLTNHQLEEVTAEYNEIFDLPTNHSRFNDFIGKSVVIFSEADRIKLVKLLFAKFADLHAIKIAHRDVGDHSIWFSPGKEIALSNFISAYHQPQGTVGELRSLLSVTDDLEQSLVTSHARFNPFQKDVYSLVVLAWHILIAKRISPQSIKSLTADMSNTQAWYATFTLNAIGCEVFNHAGELLDAFCKATPSDDGSYDIDDADLEKYRRSISHSRHYREDNDLIVETDLKEIYVSDGRLVKAWLNVSPDSNHPKEAVKVLHFLQRLDKLSALNPSYLPAIREFGLATKSSSLFVVSDYVVGSHWDELKLNEDQKFGLIRKLIEAVEHLHGLQIAHGDLHPKNILIESLAEDYGLKLLDMPDYCHCSNESLNHRYSPENIDSCSAYERDNFAVMRLSAELFGMVWGETSDIYPRVAESIQREMQDSLYGFRDLARFKDAIDRPKIESARIIDISVRGEFTPCEILPDNGLLYLQIERSKKNDQELRVRFLGVGGSIDLIYSSQKQVFTIGFPPRERASVSINDIDKSHIELAFGLTIHQSSYSNLNAINIELKNSAELQRVLKDALEKVIITELPQTDILVFDNVLPIDQANTLNVRQTDYGISTSSLWKAILDTETESHPYVEVTGAPFSPSDNKDQLIIPYEAEVDPLGSFRSDDVIEAISVDGDDEVYFGEVNLKSSQLKEVRLTKLKARAKGLKDGDIIYFRSKQDKASFQKRKNALKRLINKEGAINNLIDYFEPNCILPATQYDISVTDTHFARYDRSDEHGNTISLNQLQRDAFTKLIKSGPLSLLQGPPGTGKTEFIAAFVHFLIETQGVKRILLVSQSHEAVNTAAERIRKHCARLNTALNVVRFSNREGAVSDALKDVYSHSIITEKRELFRAEAKYRARSLSQALGLDPDYLAELIEVELKLFKQLDHYHKLCESLSNTELSEDDTKATRDLINNIDQSVREAVFGSYQITLKDDESLLSIKDKVFGRLNTNFNINPSEALKAKALLKISSDMLDVLDTDRVNYDEFLARSRQLVTGTCVGIGQRHIGIHDNQYDWVIIDEAARSIASELAIAMQSGKRILLVGDHKQLPPLYSKPHQKALARRMGIITDADDLDLVLASDFARVFNSQYGGHVGAQLLTQYRMAPAIGSLVSTVFYDGKLQNGDRKIPAIYADGPALLRSQVTWLDISKLTSPYHSDDKGISIYNRCEADQIISLLQDIAEDDEFIDSLIEHSKGGEPAIGVICMYGEQKRLIRKKFNEKLWNDTFKSLVKIDTVDSYQGKENRIIILSITRNDKFMSPGFLRSPNRINVALSRAMDRLVIVGATKMWRGKNTNLPLGRVLSFIEQDSFSEHYNVVLSNGVAR